MNLSYIIGSTVKVFFFMAYLHFQFRVTSALPTGHHSLLKTGWPQFETKNSRTSHGFFKDVQLTFQVSSFMTYSVNVLPNYRVFNDDNFRQYAMFLASYL